MYTITRQDAAEILWVSTRSVDRYIKAGKLRSKKDGKIIYIHSKDIENISGESVSGWPEVIIPQEKKQSYSESKNYEQARSTSTDVMDAQSRATLEKIYLDLRWEIQTKDKAIQDLSIRLGQAQEIAKNSVSLVEFKKSQFLLEESKGHISNENSALKEKTEELTEKLKYEKTSNMILIGAVILWIIIIIFLLFSWV